MAQAFTSLVSEVNHSFQDLKQDKWKGLLVIYIAFTLVSALILTPVISITIQAVVSFSGQAALSDTEIATFLLTPAGAIAGMCIAAFTLMVAFITYAGLLVACHACYHNSSAHLPDTLRIILAKGPDLLKLALRFTIAVLCIALPFLILLGLDYLYFLGENDINYYLSKHPPEFFYAMSIAAVLLITMGVLLVKLAISWFYALPLVLFANHSSKEAKKRSTELSKGEHRTIASWLALWLFGTPLLISLLNAPFNAAAHFLLPQFSDKLALLAITLGCTLTITTTISFLTSFFAISILAKQNIEMFERCGLDTTVPRHFGEKKFKFPKGEKFVLSSALGILIIAAIGCYFWVSGLQQQDQVLIIAHRGASEDAPENTMAAIQLAIDSKADWIEIDVQETADGEVVVFHDSDFKRVGNTKLNIWDAQSQQLPDIEIGSWFDPQFANETTPTLREVLNHCNGKAGVLIELKYYGHDVALEKKVVEIVEATKMVDQVMIMSLKYEGIQKIRELRPDWTVGLLSTVSLGDITKLDVDFLGLNNRAATPQLIQRAHNSGIDIYVWTVNSVLDISAMTSRGVDGLITDAPARAHEVLLQRAELQPGQRLLLELAHVFGRESNDLIQ
ncbi:glycerophosphodiester phosphodiesterase family protein [Rubritalea tangerina]|uniref:Glycerophosphodiester phosphodiesterase family protein n=1 Tax=Rubritalea tangerina TaxID=430798 RepID=A0ABW4Z693_9BACT